MIRPLRTSAALSISRVIRFADRERAKFQDDIVRWGWRHLPHVSILVASLSSLALVANAQVNVQALSKSLNGSEVTSLVVVERRLPHRGYKPATP